VFRHSDGKPARAFQKLERSKLKKRRRKLVAGKPEPREYKAVFVIGGQEVSQFSTEITVNCG
jgi:hypothetical protein